jgi:hypothetical protein
MVSVLVSSAIDHGFKLLCVKPKSMIFVASLRSTQHERKEQRLFGSES